MPQGDFESTPVMSIVADPRSGRIQAQNGRKVKTNWMPRWSLAAIGDLAGMVSPSMRLRIKIDENGNVTDVRATRSSGSDNVDLEVFRAVETWWFEPKKDSKTGKTVPDKVDLDIYFIS